MGKFNEYLDIEAKVEDIKDGAYKRISFWDIKSKAVAEAILNEITEPGNSLMGRNGLPQKNVVKAWYAAKKDGSVGLYVLVASDKANDFLETGFKNIIFRFLKATKPDGRPLYDSEKILRLEDVVAHKIESADTLKDKFKAMSDAEISVSDLWQRYLNNINDPTTREALALYSQIYTNTTYGHALSLGNVLRIRAINPEATFVLSESQWNAWGFGIKKGAKKYPMWRIVNKYDPSKQDIDAAKTKLGHELSKLGDLGVTVLEAIRIEAEKEANKGQKTVFLPYYGYDISDTYRFNPKEENPLVTKPGISGNVVYKLNALAQELENKKQENLGKENKEIMNKTEHKYTVAIDVMKNLCVSKGIDVNNALNSDTSTQDKLIQLLSNYYEYTINAKYDQKSKKNPNIINVLKPENIKKYIQDAIQLTLLMNNIPYNMNNFSHSLQYTQNEAATLGPIIKIAAESIGKAIALNESIFGDGWFGNAYKAALKKLGIKIVPNRKENVKQAEIQMETIKNDFNNFLNRINNPIIY